MPAQKNSTCSTSRVSCGRTLRLASSRSAADCSTPENKGFTFVNVSFAPPAPDASQGPEPLQPPARITSGRQEPRASDHRPTMFHCGEAHHGPAHSVGPDKGEMGADTGEQNADIQGPDTNSDSCPDTGAYSLLPGDSPYVPSSVSRSRVETASVQTRPTTPRTRNRSARSRNTRKKPAKSSATVISSDEEDHSAVHEPPPLRQTESLKRGRANTTSGVTPPNQSKRSRGTKNTAPAEDADGHSQDLDPGQFIDDKAEVESDAQVAVSADEASDADLNAYDSNDSFIDDSSIHGQARSVTPEESSGPSGVDTALMPESLLQNETFVRALLSKLERERGLNLDGLSDEEQRMELARRDSLIMGMRPWLTSYSQSSAPHSPLATQQRDGHRTLRTPITPTRRGTLAQISTHTAQSPSPVASSTKGKGKGKARASDASLEAEDKSSAPMDDGDQSQFEKDTHRAIRESRMPIGRRFGETSCAGTSSHVTTSTAVQGPPVTTALATPHTMSTIVAATPGPTAATQSGPPPTTPSTPSVSALGPGLTPVTPPANTTPVHAPPQTGGNVVNASTLSSRCPPLPPVCEVTNSELQDPLLAATYVACVALLARELVPWSDLQGPGQVNVSAWADQCPNMSMDLMICALVFERSGNFVNPSRADPRITRVRELGGASPRYNLYVDTGSPLIAITTGFLEASQLTAPSDAGLRQQFVRIIGHTQEWPRQQGFTGMAFGFQRLHTQLSRDTLQISTRALSTRRALDLSPGDRSTPQGMFNRSGSSTNTMSARVTADLFSLPADQPVPTYDARGAPNLDFDVALPLIGSVLPPWRHGEIPYGSAVIVAYTMTVYRSNVGNWTLGCNIQFVVVLGTPTSFVH